MTMYLSAISHTHGKPRLIHELDEPGTDDPQLAQELLQTFRESAVPALDMACDVGGRTLATAGITPDAVVYATETDDSAALVAGERISSAIAHPSVLALTVAGHGCGNLGLLLQVAQGLLHRSPAVLLITSDRAGSWPRMMTDGLSVISDGAAAVLATREAPASGSPTFLVHGLSLSTDTRGQTDEMTLSARRRVVQLGRSAVAANRSASGLRPQDFTSAMFNNYRAPAQRFLAGAAGFTAQQLLMGPVAEYAHAFAADLLVNCDLLSRSGAVVPGDRIALSATGPHSWALVDVEVIAA